MLSPSATFEGLLICRICKLIYDNAEREPKRLPCGDTICAYCVDEQPVTAEDNFEYFFACPACDSPTPATFAHSTNKDILDLLTEFKKLERCGGCRVWQTTVAYCSTCKYKGKSTAECTTCANCILKRHCAHVILTGDKVKERREIALNELEPTREKLELFVRSLLLIIPKADVQVCTDSLDSALEKSSAVMLKSEARELVNSVEIVFARTCLFVKEKLEASALGVVPFAKTLILKRLSEEPALEVKAQLWWFFLEIYQPSPSQLRKAVETHLDFLDEIATSQKRPESSKDFKSFTLTATLSVEKVSKVLKRFARGAPLRNCKTEKHNQALKKQVGAEVDLTKKRGIFRSGTKEKSLLDEDAEMALRRFLALCHYK